VCAIYNASIREGFMPSRWKEANVVPVPKAQQRGHSKKLFVSRCSTTVRRSFFSMRVINCWNQY